MDSITSYQSNYSQGYHSPNRPFWLNKNESSELTAPLIDLEKNDKNQYHHNDIPKKEKPKRSMIVRFFMLLCLVISFAFAIIGVYHFQFVKQKTVDIISILWWSASFIILLGLMISVCARKCKC
ncbi:hypothetical protein DLAC_11072 [Tieghemostelium lacteum]|uniref:Transmembrane protein n=1 Tax=Tieghemostelium lacteum TaxID=361077 RepID=A0A151Z3I0_TIELA|nr:hypothetical protein DLAC_11072 [Tieghemostelium lacteum]|eukprot:KYQ88374.1 hypothetical protein DLAC_11072 [Tieghemostelium lacteum]